MKDMMFEEFKNSYFEYLNSVSEDEFYQTLNDAMSFSFSEMIEEDDEIKSITDFINIDEFIHNVNTHNGVLYSMKNPPDKNIVIQNIELVKLKESLIKGSLLI